MSVRLRVVLIAVVTAFNVVAFVGMLTGASWESAGIRIWLVALLACMTAAIQKPAPSATGAEVTAVTSGAQLPGPVPGARLAPTRR
jgi:hypothetical protein